MARRHREPVVTSDDLKPLADWLTSEGVTVKQTKNHWAIHLGKANNTNMSIEFGYIGLYPKNHYYTSIGFFDKPSEQDVLNLKHKFLMKLFNECNLSSLDDSVVKLFDTLTLYDPEELAAKIPSGTLAMDSTGKWHWFYCDIDQLEYMVTEWDMKYDHRCLSNFRVNNKDNLFIPLLNYRWDYSKPIQCGKGKNKNRVFYDSDGNFVGGSIPNFLTCLRAIKKCLRSMDCIDEYDLKTIENTIKDYKKLDKDLANTKGEQEDIYNALVSMEALLKKGVKLDKRILRQFKEVKYKVDDWV